MIMDQLTWYAVRNTRGVTGFVGPGSKTPIPLTDEEVRRMGVENVSVRMDIKTAIMSISSTARWTAFPALWRKWMPPVRRFA